LLKVKQKLFKENSNRYLIKTPLGYENFKGVQKKYVKDMYTFVLEDDTYIKCSGKHLFLTEKGFQKAKDISLFSSLTNNKIKSIDVEYGNFEVYDPVGVENHSTYYSNSLVSHNTNFLGSTSTLISGSKLRSLVFGNPIVSYDDLDVYEEPSSNSSYVLTVDCAEGVDLDYSIIQVVDVTSIPYKQVAKYRSNRVAPLVFPNIIYSIGRKYNDAFVLVETNSVGQQVVDILHYDLEYENIFRLETHAIKGQSISSGFKRTAGFGIKTSKSVKKIGCANLKALVENDKITLTDFDTISELNTFTRDRDTYKAEEGNNDDLCMGLVLFAWLTAQSFFREYTSTDIRQQLLDHTNTIIEDSLAPVGIFDGNYEDESEKFTDSDGDAWSVVKERGYLPSNF
jgi:hypothetical protein